jgi:hypothetical protein
MGLWTACFLQESEAKGFKSCMGCFTLTCSLLGETKRRLGPVEIDAEADSYLM